ncbi:MAG: glycogen synthase GlgA [Candidatus Omnitrophica bacterium]|nr:glycogen synthase GlgA [Candidatus Omnitrophota bacterium]
MKIAIITSEMVPFARAGGLGDVVGALVMELGKMGYDIRVILPKYKQIEQQRFRLKRYPDLLEVPMGRKIELFMVQSTKLPYGPEALFIDKPEFFDRDELYGTPQGPYPDNDRRFIVFQRAALEFLRRTNFKPDIIHLHDWQTGLVPLMLRTVCAQDATFKKSRTLFTVHNLSQQGLFPPDSLADTGIEWKEISLSQLQFQGKISFLKAGLIFADMISTVSQKYSEEIQSEPFGCGMEDVIRSRAGDLEGIINGIDVTLWDPETDTSLAANYSKDTLEKKRENTLSLEKELGLAGESAPLFGFVSRLNQQKGLDTLIPALEKLAEKKIRVAALGVGEDQYQKALLEVAHRFPKLISVNIGFDEVLARRIYAGSDIMLLPSNFEPCGLGHMIALRYGSVPLVRATGGFMDVIDPCGADGTTGNGFMFHESSSNALVTEVFRAAALFDKKKIWREIILRGMNTDVSWKTSAKKYTDLYKRVTKKAVVA